MSADQWLRLITVIGLVIGAWRAFKATGKPTRFEGRNYYRQEDGSYRTLWGRRVKDEETQNALAALEAKEQGPG